MCVCVCVCVCVPFSTAEPSDVAVLVTGFLVITLYVVNLQAFVVELATFTEWPGASGGTCVPVSCGTQGHRKRSSPALFLIQTHLWTKS